MNRTYQIKQGDTLSDIARRHHTTADEIAKRNAIPAPHILYPGQTLILPDANALALDSAASIEGAMLAALCASNKDCKSPVGPCPFNNAETALVPVRYALDEPFEAPATQPHPLPATGFKGPLALNTPYTLRQLRDGWLYVFDETAHILDEYEVKGTQFIHANKGSKGHVLYPARHTVAMAFSHQRWTERLKTAYCEQDDLRSKGMRRFALPSLARNMGGPHAGLPALLASHVADMGLPNDGFVMSCAPLKAPDGVEPGLLWRDKPAGSSYASRANMPDPQSALVVALDDLISDMHDVTIRQAAVWCMREAPFDDDLSRHKWTMATITEMIGLPPVDEWQLPAAVKGNRLATFQFKKNLLAYANAEWERRKFMRAPSTDYSTPQMAASLTERVEQALAVLQGYKPTPELAQAWGEYRYQDVVRWQELESYIAQHQPLEDKLSQQWASTCDDALTGLEALPINPLLLGFDTQTPAGQTYLIASLSEWLSTAQMMGADEKRAAALQKILQKGALPAQAYYGFDAAVKEELVAKRPWLNISHVTAGMNAAAGWSLLANEGRLLDSKLFAGLGASSKATMDALHQAIAGPAIKAWERLMMMLRPLVLKGSSGAAWVAAATLEAVHTGQAVRFNKSFGTELKAWLQQQRDAAGMQSRLLGTPGRAITSYQTQGLGQAGQQLQRVHWPRLLLIEGKQVELEANMARYQSLLRQGGRQSYWEGWQSVGWLG
ncbi:LysM domain-containing protein [Aeromonas veronii]|uniref:LysM domain-containing protein n=1 Tax=Aeromonas veronii TaxID=654 RepID=A0A3A9IL24_AERVE|nr:toxin VasX [Aeromonas veronii]RKJ88961.1 LysM domain-containing protein [Aeromonas veronii]RKJ89723.1 LysM domain-containing protein [Aeromonas veronii]